MTRRDNAYRVAKAAVPKQPAPSDDLKVPDTAARTESLAPQPHGLRNWARYVPLGLAAVVDTALAVPAFDAVLRSYEILSWLFAIVFSILTLVLAFEGGQKAKREHKGLALVLGGAGLLLIIAVFVLRIAAAAIDAGSGVSYAGSAPASDDTGVEIVLAVVMALVMLAGSAAAWVDGFTATLSPAAIKLATSETELTRAETEMSECRASISRLTDDKAYATYQLDRVDRDLEEALRGLDAAILELQAHARFEIARLLGKPPATSGLDLPIRPDPPVNQ